MNSVLFSPDKRRRLAQLADFLIPAGAGGASASEAGVAGALLDRVIAVAPERAALLLRVVVESGNAGSAEALAALRARDAAEFDLFCETIAATYFMSPAVREQIGFPGRTPEPARADIADFEDLVTVVYEGGFSPRAV